MFNTSQYNLRDLYGNKFGASTDETTSPLPEDHAIIDAQDTAASVPGKNHKSIISWLVIAVLFVFLMQVGGTKT